MVEFVVFLLCRERLHILENAVAEWPRREVNGLYQRDELEVVREATAIPAELRRAHRAVVERMSAVEVVDFVDAGKHLESLFDAAARLLALLNDWLTHHPHGAERAKSVPAVERAMQEVLGMRNEIFPHWPWFTQQDINDGLA